MKHFQFISGQPFEYAGGRYRYYPQLGIICKAFLSDTGYYANVIKIEGTRCNCRRMVFDRPVEKMLYFKNLKLIEDDSTKTNNPGKRAAGHKIST